MTFGIVVGRYEVDKGGLERSSVGIAICILHSSLVVDWPVTHILIHKIFFLEIHHWGGPVLMKSSSSVGFKFYL